MRNTKTALFATLRRVFQLALQTTEPAEMDASRRRFLETGAKSLLLGSAATFPVLRPFSGALVPRIAIVGGGIAGLNALHHLKKNGLDATLYEASGRCGGRIFTVQDAMGEGTWTEFGGEFIDTNHADMWDLAKTFELELIDFAQPSEKNLHAEAFFFEGRHHSLKEAVAAFRTFAPRMKRDIERLPDNIDWQTTDPFAVKLDNTRLSVYLGRVGAQGWVKRFIEVAYESEYGLSPQVQSAHNLLLLISPRVRHRKIDLFGESDERYKVRGGNQRITDALAQRYAAHIQTNRALQSIRTEGSAAYSLTFSGTNAPVVADFVILALPFTKLRQCELRLPLPPKKLQCIRELGMGTNAKLMLGMNTHFWRKQGYSGLVYSDNGIPNGWDNAQLQTPDSGPAGLSILFGGPSGLKVGEGTPEAQKDIYLQKWNQVYPGAAAQYSGKTARMHWPTYEHNLGSYICYTKGQYTTIGGWEATPVDHVFFAGEHCGGAFSGFMNGAAQSGREAAAAVLKKVF
jgi:monoamine oxidase